MAIPLEDSFSDILGKAQRGLALSDSTVASRSGLTVEAVQALRAGNFDAAAAGAVATVLELDPKAVVDLGRNAYAPADIGSFDGLAQFNTAFDDMTVNAYLVWDPKTGDAAAFDTGGDCGDMLELIRAKNLKPRVILLTHTHGDHIFDLDRLKHETGAPAYVSAREELEGAKSIYPGKNFALAAKFDRTSGNSGRFEKVIGRHGKGYPASA